MSLSDSARTTLRRLADILVPGGQGMPPASAADVAQGQADRVLGLAPHLAAPLARFLGAAATVTDLPQLQRQADADPEGFAALATLVSNAYFMHPEVRAAIGYPGQEARDSSVGLTDVDRRRLSRVAGRPRAR